MTTVSLVVSAVRPNSIPSSALQAQLQSLPFQECFLVGNTTPTNNFQHIPDANLARARNTAVQQATADIICFIEADYILSAGWFDALLAPFFDETVVGVKGAFRTNQTGLPARFLQAEYTDRDRRLIDEPRIDFIDLYSAAIRRDVFLANGGFDENIPYLHDREFGYRLAARGYRIVFAPDAAVEPASKLDWRDYLSNKLSAGFWNAQVVRRFPTRGVSDSHTPPSLKMQIGLAALLLPLLIFAPFSKLARQGAQLIVMLMVGTMVPFTARTARRDVAAATIAPVALTGRAVALGLGFGWGLIRPKPHITNQQTTIGGLNYIAKRTLDIIGGLVGCLILLFILPVVGLAIKLESRGSIFFIQERIGQDGKPFRCVKFRTMVADAEDKLAELIDIESLEEPAFKLEDDPRVTKIGRMLRRWSLDELPQFWNVLRGEMSLVGPRPEETRIVNRYNAYHRRRLAVKPGLSGPMQVNGRGDLPLNERVRLEIDYIERYTLRRDLEILLQTLPAVFKGEGAR